MSMHPLTRHALVIGLCILPATSAWALGDLDVTIRVIERHERLEDFSHRIELPREASAAARERVTPRWQNEGGSRFRETGGDQSAPERLERSHEELERRVLPERAREWSREREESRDAWRRNDERRSPDVGDRPRH